MLSNDVAAHYVGQLALSTYASLSQLYLQGAWVLAPGAVCTELPAQVKVTVDELLEQLSVVPSTVLHRPWMLGGMTGAVCIQHSL